MQAFIMFLDEEFHKKRCLGLWERLGHPLDTITVLVPLLFSVVTPHSHSSAQTYAFLALFSCLFITKDEFIHAKVCLPIEHWLHAILFILHPLVFLATYFFWSKGGFEHVLIVQSVLTFFFLIYQVLRWSLPWTFIR
jgi:hypothetical protein